MEADNPQFAVSGDTSIEFDLNDARHMTIDTGKAIDPYNAVLETYRSLADGTAIDSLVFQSYGNHSYWATPTSPVTIGGFHLKTNWVLAQPLVAADVSSPASLHLDATYPGYRPNEQVRFTGTQTLDIVAAGAGTKSDLEGLDVGGKLALLYPPRNACVVKKFQLQNAEAAGAAGVVIDATNHGNVVGHDCGLTILPYWFFDQRPVVPMPFVEVPGRQASALRALIKQGEVQVTITDNGNTPYEQDVTLVQQGQVPVSLHYRFGPDQQSQTQENYDASTSVIVDHSYTNFLPDEGFVGGTEYNFAGQVSHQVTVAPLSDSIVNDITTTIETSDYQTALEVMSELAVYDTAGDQGEQSWGDVPTQPGVPAPPGDVFIAQPGRWSPFAFCSACRQGNYFLPWTYLTTAQPLEQDQMALPGLDPSTVHLYLGGQEIPPTQNDYGLSEYKLPSRNARYRLTMAYANSTTEWTFDSARPRHDTTPENYACAGAFYFNLTGPCEASPLIFLRYDAHVGLADDVSAPGRHVMDVTAYGQSDTSLHVDQLELWTSIDGGQTWKRAGVTASGDGRFTATYRVGKSSGALSIKTLAADSRGSTVTQTLLDAVGLS